MMNKRSAKKELALDAFITGIAVVLLIPTYEVESNQDARLWILIGIYFTIVLMVIKMFVKYMDIEKHNRTEEENYLILKDVKKALCLYSQSILFSIQLMIINNNRTAKLNGSDKINWYLSDDNFNHFLNVDLRIEEPYTGWIYGKLSSQVEENVNRNFAQMSETITRNTSLYKNHLFEKLAVNDVFISLRYINNHVQDESRMREELHFKGPDRPIRIMLINDEQYFRQSYNELISLLFNYQSDFEAHIQKLA
jgi:hypothetical protein